MFAAVEAAEVEAKLAATPRCLFDSPACGLAWRAAEYAAWVEEYGNFGSGIRSHAWTVQITCPDEPTSRCQATVLSCSVRSDRYSDGEECRAATASPRDELLYRARASASAVTGKANPTAARTLPSRTRWITPGPAGATCRSSTRWPDDAKSNDRWWDATSSRCYPEGWLENGGPVRTHREKLRTRHHAGPATPYRGYDMGVPKPEPEDK